MTDDLLDTSGWRSLLFVPGSRPDRFEKALGAGADVVCIDLEDAVAPDAKDEARRAVVDFLTARDGTRPVLGLRINGVDGEDGEKDLDILPDLKTDFVMMPKVAGKQEVDTVHDVFGRERIITVLESARGIQAAEVIADHPAVIGAIYGAIDLAADIGCTLDWDAHLYGRSRCALAFGAARKVLFDVPYLDVKDTEGLKAATRRAATLGIHARTAIHPAQVPVIHEALAPSAEEVAEAKRVLEAFEAAKGGVVLLDGKMVELPVIKSARRVLARAAG